MYYKLVLPIKTEYSCTVNYNLKSKTFLWIKPNYMEYSCIVNYRLKIKVIRN
jgi:hypothetical protein